MVGEFFAQAENTLDDVMNSPDFTEYLAHFIIVPSRMLSRRR
jgi:hypothetical protein